MIEIVRKVLKKLINNAEKYQVSIYCCNASHRMGNFRYYQISFREGNLGYNIDIWRDDEKSPNDFICLSVTNEYGSHIMHGIQSTLDERHKYEILDLCQKLKDECEEYTRSKFTDFGNEESDDELE